VDLTFAVNVRKRAKGQSRSITGNGRRRVEITLGDLKQPRPNLGMGDRSVVGLCLSRRRQGCHLGFVDIGQGGRSCSYF